MKRDIYDILEAVYCWLVSAFALISALIHG